MPSYILRNIDPDLWAKVKARSEQDGLPLRAVILGLLEQYGEHGITVRLAIKKTKDAR